VAKNIELTVAAARKNGTLSVGTDSIGPQTASSCKVRHGRWRHYVRPGILSKVFHSWLSVQNKWGGMGLTMELTSPPVATQGGGGGRDPPGREH
jgi:hypothetical protein